MIDDVVADGIPFILCHIPQTSVFTLLIEQTALAIKAQVVTHIVQSQHMTHLADKSSD
jgi:hypothetical protein